MFNQICESTQHLFCPNKSNKQENCLQTKTLVQFSKRWLPAELYFGYKFDKPYFRSRFFSSNERMSRKKMAKMIILTVNTVKTMKRFTIDQIQIIIIFFLIVTIFLDQMMWLRCQFHKRLTSCRFLHRKTTLADFLHICILGLYFFGVKAGFQILCEID